MLLLTHVNRYRQGMYSWSSLFSKSGRTIAVASFMHCPYASVTYFPTYSFFCKKGASDWPRTHSRQTVFYRNLGDSNVKAEQTNGGHCTPMHTYFFIFAHWLAHHTYLCARAGYCGHGYSCARLSTTFHVPRSTCRLPHATCHMPTHTADTYLATSSPASPSGPPGCISTTASPVTPALIHWWWWKTHAAASLCLLLLLICMYARCHELVRPPPFTRKRALCMVPMLGPRMLNTSRLLGEWGVDDDVWVMTYADATGQW